MGRRTWLESMMREESLSLDVGCGARPQATVNIDVDKKRYIEQWRKNKIPNLILGDAKHLPFRNETFTKIISCNSLCYIGNEDQAFQEMNRVLKPFGELKLSHHLFPYILKRIIYYPDRRSYKKFFAIGRRVQDTMLDLATYVFLGNRMLPRKDISNTYRTTFQTKRNLTKKLRKHGFLIESVLGRVAYPGSFRAKIRLNEFIGIQAYKSTSQLNMEETRNCVVGRYFMPVKAFHDSKELDRVLLSFKNIKQCTFFSYANSSLEHVFRRHGYRKFRTTETVILDLTKSEQDLWMDMDKKRRNGIRYAIKHGVTVKPWETEQEFQIYLKMWRDMFDRRKWAYGTDSIVDWWEESKKVSKLFLAMFDGKMIACSQVRFGDVPMPYYLVNCSLDEYRCYKPNDLLIWEIAKWLKQQGYKQFNLVGSTRFKMEFSRSGRINVDGWIKGESQFLKELKRISRNLQRIPYWFKRIGK